MRSQCKYVKIEQWGGWSGTPIDGRNWLSRIPIDWGEIKVLRAGDEEQKEHYD